MCDGRVNSIKDWKNCCAIWVFLCCGVNDSGIVLINLFV